MSSRSARVMASRERRRALGGIPPRGNWLRRSRQTPLSKLRSPLRLLSFQARNDSLEKALATREQTEKSIPTQNGSLNATQTAQGIQMATGAKEGEATANGQFIQLDLPLGQQALSALQLVPLLQKGKADLTLEVSNDEKALDLEKQSHQSDLKADEAKLNACQAELKSVKRSKLKAVMRDVGIGLGVGIAIGLHIR
jgi:hypothetical protein